jgi:hypothetical protein
VKTRKWLGDRGGVFEAKEMSCQMEYNLVRLEPPKKSMARIEGILFELAFERRRFELIRGFSC